jgi:hypothetical protein
MAEAGAADVWIVIVTQNRRIGDRESETQVDTVLGKGVAERIMYMAKLLVWIAGLFGLSVTFIGELSDDSSERQSICGSRTPSPRKSTLMISKLLGLWTRGLRPTQVVSLG